MSYQHKYGYSNEKYTEGDVIEHKEVKYKITGIEPLMLAQVNGNKILWSTEKEWSKIVPGNEAVNIIKSAPVKEVSKKAAKGNLFESKKIMFKETESLRKAYNKAAKELASDVKDLKETTRKTVSEGGSRFKDEGTKGFNNIKAEIDSFAAKGKGKDFLRKTEHDLEKIKQAIIDYSKKTQERLDKEYSKGKSKIKETKEKATTKSN